MDDKPPITILSFGFLHGPAPDATLVVDVRGILYDPHRDPALKYKTVYDPEIRAAVRRTPGALDVVDRLVEAAGTLAGLGETTGTLVTIAIGCAGGRRRSATVALMLAVRLAKAGHRVELEHMHVDEPVVERSHRSLADVQDSADDGRCRIVWHSDHHRDAAGLQPFVEHAVGCWRGCDLDDRLTLLQHKLRGQMEDRAARQSADQTTTRRSA